MPVTYRGDPLPDGEDHLVGVMEHSVLGTRHVYDACGDPVFVATVLDTIRSGGQQAELRVRAAGGGEAVRAPGATARGTGDPSTPVCDPTSAVSGTDGDDRTTVAFDGGRLTVMRRLGPAPRRPGPRRHVRRWREPRARRRGLTCPAYFFSAAAARSSRARRTADSS